LTSQSPVFGEFMGRKGAAHANALPSLAAAGSIYANAYHKQTIMPPQDQAAAAVVGLTVTIFSVD
jgi:hypothetical protein